MEVRRGQVWRIRLSDDTKGSEQSGDRFCIVISNNVGNHYAPVVTVALITSKDKDVNKKKIQPTHVKLMIHKPSLIMTEQMMTVSKERLYEYFGKVDNNTMKQVDKAIEIALGLCEGYNK